MIKDSSLKKTERIAASLADLYRAHGFSAFVSGNFEEYSLYLDNRDFLGDKNVITFVAPDGRLLALRPDATINILKNIGAEQTSKVFYNENVYRYFRGEVCEIKQTGVEVIGEIDAVTEAEVASLIIDSLECIGERYLLDVSHMGFALAVIDEIALDPAVKPRLFALLRAKNIHDALKLQDRLIPGGAEIFAGLAAIDGEPEPAMQQARKLCDELSLRSCGISAKNSADRFNVSAAKAALEELDALFSLIKITRPRAAVNVNFAIAGNVDYYNGIVFNGYVEGVPHAALFGGRYDKLAAKLGKCGAIGFALYLGELERYFAEDAAIVDVLLLYDDDASAALAAADALIAEGKSVLLASSVPKCGRFKNICKIADGKPVLLADDGNLKGDLC